MLIYRLGHKYLKVGGVPVGPYRGESVYEEWMREPLRQMLYSHNEWDQPTPYRDGIEDFDDTYYCAFEYIEQLYDWFYGWTGDLFRMDFEIHVYDIPADQILFGDKQVMAPIAGLEPVERLCLMESDPENFWLQV